MVEEVTNPLFGRLNLFYNQLELTGEKVAEMRANGNHHSEIDIELSYMGKLNQRLAEICMENGLNIGMLLERGVEAVVSRRV